MFQSNLISSLYYFWLFFAIFKLTHQAIGLDFSAIIA